MVGLPTPTTAAGRRGMQALLADPAHALLGLDFDGTLAPIVADPDEARVHPDVPRVLARLASRLGQVAIVTGRPALVAVDRAAVRDVTHLVVLGHYGLERWEGGAVTGPAEDPAVAEARSRIVDVLAAAHAPAGVYVEDKGRSVAVHTRRAADPGAALALLNEPLHDLADELGLAVEPGRLVLELRPRGWDKGEALRALAEQREPSAVVFIGDDLGDLAAFDGVDQLRERGVPGLLVCSGSTEVREVADRADLVVDGPPGVVELLAGLADYWESTTD